MKRVLGIDGGGTHTRALLVDSAGRALGEGRSGPSNYHNVGMERAVANIREAAERAGAGRLSPSSAFLGCAGIKASCDVVRMVAAAEAAGIAPPGGVTVANDLYNALAGGLSGRAGIALIAGTGANCLARDCGGVFRMCGGWGWLFDVPGSGFGLTLAAIHACTHAADGIGPDTRLLPELLAFLGLSEPNELLARFYVSEWTPDEMAAFAPVVTRLAGEGDAVASQLLGEGAAGLAGLVVGAARGLDFPQGPEVILLGGCARSGPPYQPLVEAAIAKACPQARIVEPEHDPVYGAALNALQSAGITPLPEIRMN